ncbi:hypothetical protein ACFL35_06200 [Candidatus Riflebacteria bacterium]
MAIFLVSGCGVPDSYEYKSTIGTQGKKNGQFFGLRAVQLLSEKSGEIVTLESFTKKVQIASNEGKFKKAFAHNPKNKKLRLESPTAIAINPKNSDIAIADNSESKVFIYNKNGTFKTVVKKVTRPQGIAYDSTGKLYVISLREVKIAVYKISGFGGKLEKSIAGTKDAVLKGPVDINIKNDIIHVLEDSARRLTLFDLEGKVLLRISDKGGYGDFLSPKAVTVDKEGNIFIADTGDIPCVKFDKTGKFLSKIGVYGEENGQLMSPSGITVDGDGKVFISDDYKNNIQVFARITP